MSMDARQPTGGTSLTAGTVAVNFSAATLLNAKHGVITVEAGAVRWWDDGQTPTTTAGQLASVGDVISYLEEEDMAVALSKFKAVRTGATSGTLVASFYG